MDDAGERLARARTAGPDGPRRRPRPPVRSPVSDEIGPGAPSRLTPAAVAQLQRLAGNQGVSRYLEAPPCPFRRAGSADGPTVQRCGGGCSSCGSGGSGGAEREEEAPVQRCGPGSACLSCTLASGRGREDEEASVQGDFLGDAWKGLTAAGPAVANAARLVASVAANPSQLPVVLAAIAWDQIPESAKGPIIDAILRACLEVAKHVSFPPLPGLQFGTILQHVAIGALERALSYPTGMKIRVADRMAKIILNPSPEFSLGFFKGLLTGLWDGVTGPFVLIWDLIKISYEIQSAQYRLIANLSHAESRKKLGEDVQAAIARLEPRAAAILAQVRAGKSNPMAIITLVDQLINAALKGVESAGGSLADALLQFLNRPDGALGEGIGWVAGTLTFEVLLLVLTEGGYTALKEAVQDMRVVVRLVEAGAAAAEALAPLRAALAGFRAMAASNRALAPLVEALEEVANLLVKFLRASYGLGGAGERAGAQAAGAAERGAAREIRVAETAMGETHEITLLADGRLIRCSDRCLAMAESIAERSRTLIAHELPAESARLGAEAERLTADARTLKGRTDLDGPARAAEEQKLMARAEALERETAAAERAALDKMPQATRQRVTNCRTILDAHPNEAALKQFDGQLRQLEDELAATTPLLDDPAMRPLARDELRSLEQQASDLEGEIRKLTPEAPPPPPGPAFDANAFEASLVRLPAGERVAAVSEEAGRQAASRGFTRDRRLSTLNNRDVYVDPSNGHLYSVDTQHGRFEHCGPGGDHLGEVKLDLTPVPNTQSADHSLNIN